METQEKTAIKPRCHLPWQEMILSANGVVEPCCYWTAHGNANPPLGDINEASIEEIWNGPGYQALRANMAAGNLEAAGCARCFAVKQGHALGLEYDADCEKPEYQDTPYAQNIQTLKDEIGRGETVLTAKPTIVSVTATHKCNLACLHCYQNSSRERHWTREAAFDEVITLVPTLVRLIAGGGEPLLLSQWRRFISEFDPVQAPLLNFAMTTNATIVQPEVIDGLKRFKSLCVVVSLDGANDAVYEKVRVNGSFRSVEANIPILRETVASRSQTGVTFFGLCMSVMKSNITHLPDYVRWAAKHGLVFSIHPVLIMPLTESLASFNDPEREMRGWREALSEARHILRTIETPVLPPQWRAAQQITGPDARQAWPYFQALEDFIPWDIAYTKHYRIRLPIPQDLLIEARRRSRRQNVIVMIQPYGGADWKTSTIPYYARIEANDTFEISLPAGHHTCYLCPEFDLGEGMSFGYCEVKPGGSRLISSFNSFGERLNNLLGRPGFRDDAQFGVEAAAV